MRNLECLPSGGQPEHFRRLKDSGTSSGEILHQPKAYRNRPTFQITWRRPGKPPAAVKQMTGDPVAEARQRRTSPLPFDAIRRTEQDPQESLRVTSLQVGGDPSSQPANVAVSRGVCVVPAGKRDWLPSAVPYPAQGKCHPKSTAASWILSSSQVKTRSRTPHQVSQIPATEHHQRPKNRMRNGPPTCKSTARKSVLLSPLLSRIPLGPR